METPSARDASHGRSYTLTLFLATSTPSDLKKMKSSPLYLMTPSRFWIPKAKAGLSISRASTALAALNPFGVNDSSPQELIFMSFTFEQPAAVTRHARTKGKSLVIIFFILTKIRKK